MTSFWVILSCFWTLGSAQAAQKHKRGQGLLPPTLAPNTKKASAKRPSPQKAPLLSQSIGAKIQDELPCVEPLQLEKLFQLPEAHFPAQAKQGAYTTRFTQGKTELTVQKTALSPALPLTTTAANLVGYEVSPQDRDQVLVLTNDDGERNAHFLKNTFKGVRSAKWRPDGQAIIMLVQRQTPARYELVQWELTTEKETLLASLRGESEILDISSDANRFLLLELDGTGASSLVVLSKSGPVARLKLETSSTIASFDPDFAGVYFLAPQSNSRGSLSFWNTRTGKAKPLTDETQNVVSFGVGPDRKRLVYSLESSGESKLEAWAIETDGSLRHKLRVPEVSGNVVEAPAVLAAENKDEVAFFYTVQSPTRPSQLWFWSQGKKELWTPASGIEQSEGCFSSARPAETGGLAPAGYVFLPKATEGPIPFVIYSEHKSFKPRFIAAIQYLTQRGYGVFAPAEPLDKPDYSRTKNWLIQQKLAKRAAVFFHSATRDSLSELAEIRQAVEGFELALKIDKK